MDIRVIDLIEFERLQQSRLDEENRTLIKENHKLQIELLKAHQANKELQDKNAVLMQQVEAMKYESSQKVKTPRTPTSAARMNSIVVREKAETASLEDRLALGSSYKYEY